MSMKIVDTLNAVGKSTEVFKSPDGTSVLMLPYGGRVLGLFLKRREALIQPGKQRTLSLKKRRVWNTLILL